jgi:hypothetical protein
MSNRYGITLDRAWTEWAAKERVSETVAAAVLLICETRPLHEVVGKLTTGEFERVVDIVHRSPDHFPSGTLAALKSSSPMPARRPQSDSVSIDQESRQRAVGTSPDTARERQAHVLRAAHLLGRKPGTRPGTRAETARRRMVVEELMKAGLNVRTISIATDIPPTSVHRAMRAVARAEAKQEIAVLKIMDAFLEKSQHRRSKGRGWRISART